MRMRALLLMLVGCGLAACDLDKDDSPCDGGIACSVTVEPSLEASDDGGDTYDVTIGAEVRGLRGGAQALISSSAGTVDGTPAGMQATIFLPPVLDAGFGTLQGHVTWVVPVGQRSELTVSIEEATGTAIEPVDAAAPSAKVRTARVVRKRR